MWSEHVAFAKLSLQIKEYLRLIARPEHLPDFGSPPLDEVVIGVQYAPIPGYSSVFAKDVWGLFKNDYPNIQEQPPLEPSFETFGGSALQSGMKLHFGPPPTRGRLWFVSVEQNHLVQFQEDRFLLNWRKRPKDEAYPHFESIAGLFEGYLTKLNGLLEDSFTSSLNINQAEVSYINIIPVEDYSALGEWFSFIDLRDFNPEGINLSFSEIINDNHGKPFARLFYELQAVVTKDGRVKAFKLALTFRGKPAGNEISEAMDFAYLGRENIVTRFKELTTNMAHDSWEIRR